MIPILYEQNETAFTSNGLGRLRDCISCTVSEERNNIYECDFQYPVDGANFDRIQLGRIILVKHDDSDDLQPFDIVSASRPINGVITFHATHVSYRQSMMTVAGTGINNITAAFNLLRTASPSNPFIYSTDIKGTGLLPAADGIPKTVKSMLGGVEGSILDTYGGEYEWNKWNVILHAARGVDREYTIRYGVNLVDYEDDIDYSEAYSAVIPYWSGSDANGNPLIIKGSMINTGQTVFGRTNCIPLDVTEKFENQPTKAQVEATARSIINSATPYLPKQNIKVNFVRLANSNEYEEFAPFQICKLCDTVKVIFPRYNVETRFKIVKTVYNVLTERFDEIELGQLSTTLAEALGL